jgi:hypothetical protein
MSSLFHRSLWTRSGAHEDAYRFQYWEETRENLSDM